MVISSKLRESPFTSKRIGVAHQADQQTVSYRTTEPADGALVPDHIADPYGWFLRSGKDQRRSNLLNRPHVYQYLQDRAREDPTFASRLLINFKDSGHAFSTHKRRVRTSVYGGAYPDSTSSRRMLSVSGPILALCEIKPSAVVLNPPPFRIGSQAQPLRMRIPTLIPQSNDLEYWGQSAIANTAVNRPVESISVFLGELRERVPRLALAFAQFPTAKNAAKDWVNANFGITPFLTDLIQISQSLINLDKHLLQKEANSYVGVRRRFKFPPTTKSSSYSTSDLANFSVGLAPPGTLFGERDFASSSSDAAGGYAWSGRLTATETRTTTFSASYSYYSPVAAATSRFLYDDRRGIPGHKRNRDRYIADVDKLNAIILGSDLSWEALWALAPWSWLVDWFFDVEASIAAHQRLADENLIVNYGYLMDTVERQVSLDAQLRWLNPEKSGSFTSVSTLHSSIRKERVRANEFGFGLRTAQALTPGQLSILAALGISAKRGY